MDERDKVCVKSNKQESAYIHMFMCVCVCVYIKHKFGFQVQWESIRREKPPKLLYPGKRR